MVMVTATAIRFGSHKPAHKSSLYFQHFRIWTTIAFEKDCFFLNRIYQKDNNNYCRKWSNKNQYPFIHFVHFLFQSIKNFFDSLHTNLTLT